MIEPDHPTTWQNLQVQVARILEESGVKVSVEKVIDTARGKVEIDVWAFDDRATPEQTYLLECKNWRSRVPKTVVHAFRTVVGDSGANWGAIISKVGFQKGAWEAAQYSNVRLLTWMDFQTLLHRRWYSSYFLPAIQKESSVLIEYTEPINSQVSKRVAGLSKADQREFAALREKHKALGWWCALLSLEAYGFLRVYLTALDMISEKAKRTLDWEAPKLPMRGYLGKMTPALPDAMLDAPSLRQLLSKAVDEIQKANSDFTNLFSQAE